MVTNKIIMKKLILILFVWFCSLGLAAQNKKNKKHSPDFSYCMIVKGDEQVLTQNGTEIKEDVKLKNGDRLSAEGRVRRTDGTEIKLKEGECINNNGEVIKPK